MYTSRTIGGARSTKLTLCCRLRLHLFAYSPLQSPRPATPRPHHPPPRIVPLQFPSDYTFTPFHFTSLHFTPRPFHFTSMPQVSLLLHLPSASTSCAPDYCLRFSRTSSILHINSVSLFVEHTRGAVNKLEKLVDDLWEFFGEEWAV